MKKHRSLVSNFGTLQWTVVQQLAASLGKFSVILCFDISLLKLSFHKFFLIDFWHFLAVPKRSISEDSLRRYVQFASESCIQELLMSASDSNKLGNCSDGWKILTLDNGVEISKRRSGSLHIFRSRWVLRSVSPQQFITVANAIDAAKVRLICCFC